MEQKLRTLGSLSAKNFSAHLDEVRLRSGRITQRIKIDYPPAVAVVPFLDSEHILMVRQWRYAPGCETLEIPAGKAEPDEGLEDCALRELEEETGYTARRLLPVFSYYPALGYSNEVISIYAALDLVLVSQGPEEEEISQVEVVGLDEIWELILGGTIRDGKSVIAVNLFEAKKQRGDYPS